MTSTETVSRVQTSSKDAKCNGCFEVISKGDRYLRVMVPSGRKHIRSSGRMVPSALPYNGILRFHIGCEDRGEG